MTARRSTNRTVRAAATATNSPVRAVVGVVPHDRIHAREPDHDRDRWTEGTVLDAEERNGHYVVTVRGPDGDAVELAVTFAVRDLFLDRLPIEADELPVGERVWYRKRGE